MKFATNIVLALATLSSAAATSILEIVVASEDHTTLEAAVLAAPSFIADTLGDRDASLTLFAPDDTAFANLIDTVGADYVNDLLTPPWAAHLTCVLTSHVLGSVVFSDDITGPLSVETLSGYEVSVDKNGGTVTVDDIPVTVADIEANNGVIHSISALPILPPCVTVNIYDLGAASLDNFSTLISLVDAAGLKNSISITRPLTLFAPTNDAFAKVPAEILDFLGSNVDALKAVLTYHVVNEIVLFGDNTLRGNSYETLNGDEITIGRKDGSPTVEGATISSTDVLASNGLVHIIDHVLIPPSLKLPSKESPVYSPVYHPAASPAYHPAVSPVYHPAASPAYSPVYDGKGSSGGKGKGGSIGKKGGSSGKGKGGKGKGGKGKGGKGKGGKGKGGKGKGGKGKGGKGKGGKGKGGKGKGGKGKGK